MKALRCSARPPFCSYTCRAVKVAETDSPLPHGSLTFASVPVTAFVEN